MKIKSILIVFSLSILGTGVVYAIPIYKWTDEEGYVQFTDRPTGAPNEERLEIESRPTDPARVRAAAQARVAAAALIVQEEEAAAQEPDPEEQAAVAREREEKCNMYLERQIQFTENRRIYRMDENGERVYYNEDEMQDARDNVRDLVARYCD